MEIKKLIPVFAFLVFIGIRCAHDCNNIPQRPEPSPTPTPDDSFSSSPLAAPTPKATPAPSLQHLPTVQVFKNTGELQCGMGKAVPLQEMQSALTNKKIQVYESHTQPDGKMHMAVCGAPNGNIHVFKIPKKFLKLAEKLGFKVFVEHGE